MFVIIHPTLNLYFNKAIRNVIPSSVLKNYERNSFLDLLSHPLGYASFLEFMKQEQSENDLLFWTAYVSLLKFYDINDSLVLANLINEEKGKQQSQMER